MEDRTRKLVEREKSKYQRATDDNINAAIKALLGTKEGRDLLWWQLGECRIGQNPFTGNTLTTMFNCGQLNFGQTLMARIIEVDPNGYILMQKEKQDELRARDTNLGRIVADAESGSEDTD